MCGITGYWGYARADLAPDTFEAFTHSLAHRGPDDFAIEHWPDARLWLGHRRRSRSTTLVLWQWAVLDYVQW
jgi:asparagine synthetase B (glutamine-hydrolysing)